MPDTIKIDQGSLFVSAGFRSVCRDLGIWIQRAHPGNEAEKDRIDAA